MRIRRDGERSLVSVQEWSERVDGPRTGGWQTDVEEHANGDLLHCQSELDPADLNQVTEVGDNHILTISTGAHRQQDESGLDTADDYLGRLGVLAWYVGDRSIDQQVREAETTTETTTDSGCRLEVAGPYGELSLELDATNSWLPKAFSLKKMSQHLTGKGTVGSIEMNGGGPWPPGKVREMHWSGTITEFGRSNGFAYPKKLTLLQVYHCENGVVVEFRSEIEVNSFDYDPNFSDSDLRTSLVYPVDYQVGVRGETDWTYRWDGQRLVSQPPPLMTRLGEGSMPLVLGGIVVVAVLAGAGFVWSRSR